MNEPKSLFSALRMRAGFPLLLLALAEAVREIRARRRLTRIMDLPPMPWDFALPLRYA